jgi:hypothetical protein
MEKKEAVQGVDTNSFVDKIFAFQKWKYDNPDATMIIVSLWFAIWELSNRFGWPKDGIFHSLHDLAKIARCRSSTLKGKNSPLKKMVELGLIEFTPGKYSGEASTFKLLIPPRKGYFKSTLSKDKKGTNNEPKREDLIDQKGTNNEPKREDLIDPNKDCTKSDLINKREKKDSPPRNFYNSLKELRKDPKWYDAIKYVAENRNLDIDDNERFIKKIINDCANYYETTIDEKDKKNRWEKGIDVDTFKGFMILKMQKSKNQEKEQWSSNKSELMREYGYDPNNHNEKMLWKRLRIDYLPDRPPKKTESIYFDLNDLYRSSYEWIIDREYRNDDELIKQFIGEYPKIHAHKGYGVKLSEVQNDFKEWLIDNAKVKDKHKEVEPDTSIATEHNPTVQSALQKNAPEQDKNESKLYYLHNLSVNDSFLDFGKGGIIRRQTEFNRFTSYSEQNHDWNTPKSIQEIKKIFDDWVNNGKPSPKIETNEQSLSIDDKPNF